MLINTFSFELFGNTAAEIPTVTVTLGGAAYKLTKITYTGVRTQYYIELGQDQALFNYMLMQLGITDSSGKLSLANFTLEPGDYYFDASASGYEALLLGNPFTVTDSSPITGTITFELQKGFVLPPT